MHALEIGERRGGSLIFSKGLVCNKTNNIRDGCKLVTVGV